MNHGLFPDLVKLNQETHKYSDSEGNEYMGFSSFCDEFIIKKFNKLGAAYGVAKSENITADEVVERWNEQRELGVRIDKAIELYTKTGEISLADNDIAELVTSVVGEYSEYTKTYSQVVVYNKKYSIAGSPDKFGFTSNRKDSQFDMSDFKVFQKQDNLHDHKGWLMSPLNHLSNTKMIKIIMQLSFYAFQLEELTSKRCRKLFLHLIDPVNMTHKKIIVPYMKNDVLVLLNAHEEKIKQILAERKNNEPMSINELI